MTRSTTERLRAAAALAIAALGGCVAVPDRDAAPPIRNPWPDADRLVMGVAGGQTEVLARYVGAHAVEVLAASPRRPGGSVRDAGRERAAEIAATVYCGRGRLNPESQSDDGAVLYRRYDCVVDWPAPPRMPPPRTRP